MGIVLTLDILVIAGLVLATQKKGLENTLPLASFLFVLFPEESKIAIPGLFDMTTQRVIVLTLFILCAVLPRPLGPTPKRLPLAIYIVTLSLWWFLSAAASVVFTTSLKYVLSQLLDLFMLYYIFARYVTTTRTVRKVLYGLVAGTVVCSVFGVLEVYTQWTVMSLFPEMIHRSGPGGRVYVDMARGLRAQSTFGHPILFGSALAMTIPIALYLVSTTRGAVQRLALWVGLLLMFVCIYKTASRGPWLALVLSLGVLLVSSKAKIRRNIVIICLLTGLVFVARPGVWQTIYDDYLSTVDKNSSQGESYQYRLALYSLAAHELGRSVPRAILGYGPESFFFLKIVGHFNGRTFAYESCDSSLASLLIETGYVGFTIVMLLFYRVLRLTYRAYRYLPAPYNSLPMILLSTIVTFCFMLTNVAIFGWGQENAMFWIVVALAMVYPYLVRSEHGKRSSLTPVDSAVLSPVLAR